MTQRRFDNALFLPSELKKEYQKRIDVACRKDTGDGMTIAKVVSELCHEVGMSRVANVSGIERPVFYRLFNGKNELKVGPTILVLRAFGCSLRLR